MGIIYVLPDRERMCGRLVQRPCQHYWDMRLAWAAADHVEHFRKLRMGMQDFPPFAVLALFDFRWRVGARVTKTRFCFGSVAGWYSIYSPRYSVVLLH